MRWGVGEIRKYSFGIQCSAMAQLEDIIASFEALEPADRLEWLIEFGASLPALPQACHAERDAGQHIVHECQAPVFFKVEKRAGVVSLWADVSREAPIARGFVSLLLSAFDGGPVAQVDQAPDDMLEALHIRALLGMQRQRGLGAIYQKVKLG